MSEDSVKVAVRVRPLVTSEIERGCQNCLSVVPGEPQIQLNGTDKAFSYNYVFGSEIGQDEVYEASVKNMIQNIFKGYNITILAYGQTGSGKTYSMGTNYSEDNSLSSGIIPRAVNDMFDTMTAKQAENWTFRVTVGFLELYNEQLYDLLGDKQRKECIVDLREDTNGIKVVGHTEIEVKTANDTLKCLTQGSQGRATGATAMNAHSSRSHAIFTITVYQQKTSDSNSATTSKFHLVDLAGSERSKKTQATGDRFKEGVSINKGLLALGNVISNLGDNASHIGYRDSKLTRFLQDSLGGNSITLMIACVSPADYNFEETLSTLRYADRARKIKNKPIVNQDPKAAEINRLTALVKELKLSLLEQGPATACPPEHSELVARNRSLQKKLRELSEQLNHNLIEFVGMHERAELAESSREKLREELVKVIENIRAAMGETDIEKLHPALQKIYDKMVELQNHQKQTNAEIMHQISLEKNVSINGEKGDSGEDGNDTLNESIGLDEEHTQHTLRQAERNQEVNNINRALALKEELIARFQLNASQSAEHYKEIQEMENEIKNLQAEKERLSKALEGVQASNVSAKIAEERRKKVRELEKKISELTKKCTEQNRILKSKEKSDEQIKNLNTEIQALKQMRVKLVRDMRKESEKFHQYKLLREKELYKLKDQDRKRKNQMERLQILHNKQQNVMKRKMEEANAINKKLKETLELQKKVRASRKEMGKKAKDFIQGLVNQEVKVIQDTVDAKIALDMQMKYREMVAESVKELKKQMDENPSEKLKREICDHEEYLELCTMKISQIQSEIVSSDQENMINTRLEGIHTIAEAKQVAQLLFDTIEQNYKNYRTEVSAVNEQYENLMAKHDQLLTKYRKLELTPTVSLEEHRKLQAELQVYKNMENELEEKRKSFDTEKKTAPKKSMALKPAMHYLEVDTDKENFDTDDSFNDDVDKDPDWQKTPLQRRTRSIFVKVAQNGEVKAKKRSSESVEIKCQCKTKCSSNICKCHKVSSMCTNDCGCNPTKCENRNNTHATCYFDEGNSELAGQAKKIRIE